MPTVTIDKSCDICIDSDGFQQSPSGIHCTFIKFGSTGLKCYSEKWLRDRSYQNQLVLSDLGIAPKVGFMTEVTIKGRGNDHTYYAFETEVIDDVYRPEVYKALHESYDYDDNVEAREYISRFADAAEELANDYADTINWFDNHAGNIGFNSNGDPVIIDCADNLFYLEY